MGWGGRWGCVTFIFGQEGGRGGLVDFRSTALYTRVPRRPLQSWEDVGTHFLHLTWGKLRPRVKSRGRWGQAEARRAGARRSRPIRIPWKDPAEAVPAESAGFRPSAAAPQPSRRPVLPGSGRQVAASPNAGFPRSPTARGGDLGPGLPEGESWLAGGRRERLDGRWAQGESQTPKGG